MIQYVGENRLKNHVDAMIFHMANSQAFTVEDGINAMFAQLQESDSEVENISDL